MKIELYHDTLAQKVFQMASTEQQMRLKIEDFIRSRFAYYQQQKVLLGQEDLNYIGPYWQDCSLDDEVINFIQKSQKKLKKDTRRKRNIALIIIGILGVLLIFALYQLRQQKKMSLALYAVEALNRGYPSLAFRLAEASAEMGIDEKNRSIIEPVLQEIDRSPLACDMVHVDSVTAYDISDTLVVAGGRSGIVKLWNTQCEIKDFELVHSAAVTLVRFSPDGRYLLSGAADGSAYLKNTLTGRVDTILSDAAITHLSFLPRTPFFLIGNAAGQVRVFRDDQSELKHLAVDLLPPLISAEFSSYGGLMLIANQDELLIREFAAYDGPKKISRNKHPNPVKWLHFIPMVSPDLPVVILAAYENKITLLGENGLDNGYPGSFEYDQLYLELDGIGEVNTAQFSRDPSKCYNLALIKPDSSIINWSFIGIQGFTVSNPVPVVFASYSIRKFLVLSLADQRLKIWNVINNKLLHDIKCHSKGSKFSLGEGIFITSDGSETIHLWDLDKKAGSQEDKAILGRYQHVLRHINMKEKEY